MLLAIDTSTAQGSVALAEKNGTAVTVRETLLDDGWQHGRLLISAVDALLREAGRRLDDVDAFACGIGPGSYTGTRIGVIAAKTLAWSRGKPLYGVSSLAALALSFAETQPQTPARVVVMQDARRDEIYTGVYTFGADGLPQAAAADTALNPAAAAALVTPEAQVAGGGAWRKYPEVFPAPEVTGRFTEFAGRPTLAASLAKIALAGRVAATDPKILEPVYLRREEAPCSFEKYAAEHAGDGK